MQTTDHKLMFGTPTAAAQAAIDAVRAGADCVDAEALTVAERYQCAEALGWAMDARTRAWCGGPSPTAKAGPKHYTRDVEGMILDRQDLEQEAD